MSRAKSSLVPCTAAHPPEPASGSPLDRLRTWAPWVLGLLAIVAAVALLGWPR
jgi:hypothetical protein